MTEFYWNNFSFITRRGLLSSLADCRINFCNKINFIILFCVFCWFVTQTQKTNFLVQNHLKPSFRTKHSSISIHFNFCWCTIMTVKGSQYLSVNMCSIYIFGCNITHINTFSYLCFFWHTHTHTHQSKSTLLRVQ